MRFHWLENRGSSFLLSSTGAGHIFARVMEGISRPMKESRFEGGESDTRPLDQVNVRQGKSQWTFLDVAGGQLSSKWL